jgi:hypothetical protein
MVFVDVYVYCVGWGISSPVCPLFLHFLSCTGQKLVRGLKFFDFTVSRL